MCPFPPFFTVYALMILWLSLAGLNVKTSYKPLFKKFKVKGWIIVESMITSEKNRLLSIVLL